MATPSHVDLSVLFVPIMPETSKLGPAMEKAGQDATDSFGKGSSGLGEKIHDSFTKATSKVRDVFDKAGSDAGQSMSDSFKQKTKGIEDAAADSGAKAGGSLVENFVSKTGGLKDFASNLGEQLGKNIGGKLGEALHNIPGMEGVTDTLQKVGDKATDLGDKFNEVKGTIQGVTETLRDLAGDAPMIAGALGVISDALVPITAGVVGGLELDKLTKGAIQHGPGYGFIEKHLEQHGMHLPGAPRFDTAPSNSPDTGVLGGAGGAGGFQIAPGSGVGAAGTAAFPPSTPNSVHIGPAAPSSFVAGANSPTVPLIQKSDGTWTSPDPAWAHLIQRESGGNPSIQNNWDSNAAAGDPSQGLFQFTTGTWLRMGGGKYAPHPGMATPQQQAEIAAKLIQANPSGSDWGAGMSGRENAGALLSGLGSGATPAGYNFYKDWYPGSDGGPSNALSTRGGPGGLGSGSGGSVPTGAQHDPLYVMPADSGPGGSGGAGSSAQSQGQQLGSGLVNGALQEVGLDGSVFKTFGGSSNPAQFGITKLATGLINTFGGLLGGGGEAGTHPLDHAVAGLPLGALDARHTSLPGITKSPANPPGTPGGLAFAPPSLGGTGGAAPAAMMGGGKAGGVGAAISGAVGLANAALSDFFNPGPVIPPPQRDLGSSVPAQGVAVGDTHNHYYGNTGPQVNVVQNGVKSPTEDLHGLANSGRAAGMTVTNSGNLPVVGT